MNIERLENIYLKVFRIFLIILATVAIVFASFNVVTSLYKIIQEADIKQINPPNWSELRYKILPITQPAQNKVNASPAKPKEPTEIKDPNEKKLLIIQKNLQKLFYTNNTLFLESIGLDFLIERTINIPTYALDNFINGLIVFSEDLAEEKRLLQIESSEKRIKIVVESIQIYEDSFIRKLESASLVNKQRIQQSEIENAEGYSQLLLTLYALGGFIFLLLCILVLKVEHNLRKIPIAISIKNEE
jgi:hypothetical protein